MLKFIIYDLIIVLFSILGAIIGKIIILKVGEK